MLPQMIEREPTPERSSGDSALFDIVCEDVLDLASQMGA